MLLATNDTMKAALLHSGKDMSRDKLDCRTPRYAFWYTAVAHVYNDPTTSTAFNCSWVVSSIDVSRLPLCYRMREELKRHYTGICSLLKLCTSDGHVLCRIIPTTSNFSTQTSVFYYTQSCWNKCMVLFKVLLCESREERNDLQDFSLRTIPACAMVDISKA